MRQLTATDRAVLRGLVPIIPFEGISDSDLADALDAWFGCDHYDNNPVYASTDHESDDHA